MSPPYRWLLAPQTARRGNNDGGLDANDVDTNPLAPVNMPNMSTETVVHQHQPNFSSNVGNTSVEASISTSNKGVHQHQRRHSAQDGRMSQHVVQIRSFCQSLRTSMLSAIETFEENYIHTITHFFDGENVEHRHGHGHGRQQHPPQPQELHPRTHSQPGQPLLPIHSGAIAVQKPPGGGRGRPSIKDKLAPSPVVSKPLVSSLAAPRNEDPTNAPRRALKRVRFQGFPDTPEPEGMTSTTFELSDSRANIPAAKKRKPSGYVPQRPTQNELDSSSGYSGLGQNRSFTSMSTDSRHMPRAVSLGAPGRGRGRGMRRTRLSRATTVEDLNKLAASERSLTPNSSSANISGGNSITLPTSAPASPGKHSKREMAPAASATNEMPAAQGRTRATRERAILEENANFQNTTVENVNAPPDADPDTENETNQVADNTAKAEETILDADGTGTTEDESLQPRARSPTPKVKRSTRSTQGQRVRWAIE